MRSFFSPLAYLWLALLFMAPLASGQGQKGSATLFARQVGNQVQAGVQISVETGWYVYHNKLDEGVIGMPLSFTWSGSDLKWAEPEMPEPKSGKVDEDWAKYTYHYHTGTIVAWFSAEGTAKLEDLRLDIGGQTCSVMDGTCILFSPSGLQPAPEAPAGFWDGAPAAFQVVQGGATGVQPSHPEGANSFGWVADYGNDRIDARYRIKTDGSKVIGRIEFDVEEGYHAYHGPTLEDISPEDPVAAPTVVELEDDYVDWGEPVYPAPHIDSGFDQTNQKIDIFTHHGAWVIEFEGTIESDTELDEMIAIVTGQVCDDMGCVNFDMELEAEIETVASLEDTARMVPTPTPVLNAEGGDGSGEDEGSLWAFLGQAVFWGIFTLLMPCTYPMIPITISFFTKQATQRGGRVLPLALTYGAGIIAIFIVIGLLAGPVIIQFAQSPITNVIIGALFIYFALTLFGIVNLEPPAFLNKMAGKASSTGGYLGVFLMGATLVITSFTCTAPFVGTLLVSSASGAAEGGGLMRVIMGMGVFGLVMATPFVFLSLVPGRLQTMPKAGGWMNTLKVFMGFVEVAAAMKFFSNADVVWKWNILSVQVFLLICIAIFIGAAIYLVVSNRKSGSNSPLQYGIAVMTLLLAGFLGTYLNGRPAGKLMSAILPPYHHDGLAKAFGDKRHYARHDIIKDNLAEAVALAKAQNKQVLLNFTGET